MLQSYLTFIIVFVIFSGDLAQQSGSQEVKNNSSPVAQSNSAIQLSFQIPSSLIQSTECKADLQKYCTKGTSQLLSNLKVLQCINNLDNVSFFFLVKETSNNYSHSTISKTGCQSDQRRVSTCK